MRPLLMFDFDGVLADSLAVFQESLAEVCLARGFPQLRDRDTFLGLFDGNMVAGLRQLGISGEALPGLLADLGRTLAARMDRYPPFPGIPGAFAELAAAGPVYVITSNVTGVVSSYLARHAMRGAREVLGSDREPSKQVKIRSLAAQWPALRPVYVGDTRGDMDEARAAGALPVAVGWGWHDEARLRRGRPHRFLRTPAELAGLAADAGGTDAG